MSGRGKGWATSALVALALMLASADEAAADRSGEPADVIDIMKRNTPGFAEAVEALTGGNVAVACQGFPVGGMGYDESGGMVIRCLLEKVYHLDDKAKKLALRMFRDTGSVAGTGAAETLDGGYRGQIELVPAQPVLTDRKHLQWVVAAMADFEGFFTALRKAAKPAGGKQAPPEPAFRWERLIFRFVRSPGKRTPSAYATGWSVTYNLRGSLLKDAASVRETLFHEIFHLNDFDHRGWSARALKTDYDAIVARCAPKLTRACLAPYAPGTTTVRGGTYYAFQQDNGEAVHEYGAELALRYYKEHEELERSGKLARPAFKCGAPENARAWQALVDEFFAGIDRTGECK